MKIKALLFLFALATSAALAQPAAQADPRFIFAPQIFEQEQARMPRHALRNAIAPTVQSGSTPGASSMLGMPLAQLRRPAQPLLAAGPVVTQTMPQLMPHVLPQVMPQLMPGLPSKEFGRPASQAVPMTASANSLPLTSKPFSAPARPAGSSRTVVAKNVTLTKNRFNAPAKAIPQIQNYAQGYVPGSTVPAFGSNVRVDTVVKAKLQQNQ